MPMGESTPCSTSQTSSSKSFDSPSSDPRQDLLHNAGAICSVRSEQIDSIIVIAVKGHEKLQIEPFSYVSNRLAKQNNCKVVVICCLSRVRNELGVNVLVDGETFGGISKNKLEDAINAQRNMSNHFLKSFRETLSQRGVRLDIDICLGRKSDDILVVAASKLRPNWVVLDVYGSHALRTCTSLIFNSFSGHQKKIQAALECNLVLMKKNRSRPLILELTPKYLGPVAQIHDQVSEEFVDPVLVASSPSFRSSSVNGTTTTMTTTTSMRGHCTTNTATSNTNSKSESGPLSPLALSPTPAATQGLPASMLPPAPQLSSLTTPPNRPNPTSQLKPTTPTSSDSWKLAGQANASISLAPSEPISLYPLLEIESGTPAPPTLSPIRVATEGLAALMWPPAPQLSGPTTSPNRPSPTTPTSSDSGTLTSQASTSISLAPSEPISLYPLLEIESGTPAPPTLSPTRVATEGLEALMWPPAPQLSSPTTSPNRPSPTAPTSSDSGTLTSQASTSISLAPSEPISLYPLLEIESGTPAPPTLSPTRVATQGLEALMWPPAPQLSGPTTSPNRPSPTTPTSSDSGTLTSQASTSISLAPSEPIPLYPLLEIESGPLAPPTLLPARVATEGLEALMWPPAPRLSGPTTSPNRPSPTAPTSSDSGTLTSQASTSISLAPSEPISLYPLLEIESGPPAPPTLSPIRVATEGLEALMWPPAPQLSGPTTPPNRPSPTTPTSLDSGTLTCQASTSISFAPSEPNPFYPLLEIESGPPAPPARTPNPAATTGLHTLTRPEIRELSSPTTPPNGTHATSQSKRTTPTSSSSWTSKVQARYLSSYLSLGKPKFIPTHVDVTVTTEKTGVATRESKRCDQRTLPPQSGPIPNETALLKARKASGVPWSRSAQQSSSSDGGRGNRGPSNAPIPDEIALAMAINASLISASEEGVPLSPPAEQSSSSDGGRGNRAPSDTPIPDEIALAMAINASLISASEEGVRLSPSAQNSYSWDVGLGNRGPSDRNDADIPSTSNSGESGTPKLNPFPSFAPSAPPFHSGAPIKYPLMDNSPVQVNYGSVGTSNVGPSIMPKNKSGGQCVVCFDGPATAVCVPCGHIAGCIQCLTTIKGKGWGCPICRETINQVLKVYAV